MRKRPPTKDVVARRMTRAETALNGVLPVDKPAGPSSHDVVNDVRRALGMRRIGHTGTLDPFASGLLLLCLGRATRIAEYLSGLDKRYFATVLLGQATDTDDSTGTVVAEHDAAGVTLDDVERCLVLQRGAVLQVPPSYSAKKREGQRAYAAARQGRPLELQPVPVRIDVLEVRAYRAPELELEVECSSGTYIRAIARDLGAALGVGAHLTALRRVAVGPHTVAGALPSGTFDDAVAARARITDAMLSPLAALRHLPRIDIEAEAVRQISHGRAVPAPAGVAGSATVAVAADGVLVAIGEASGGMVRPKKVLL
jgi:tRNA pseudouridine55 synthase